MKTLFVSTASILPTNMHGQDSAMAAIFGQRSAGALYIGLLSSRSVQDDVIDQLDLMKSFHAKDREAVRGVLASETTVNEGADSLIQLKVKDVSAQRSAQIANAYLVAFRNLNDRLSLTEGAQTRKFFEKQLEQERELLYSAEDRLAKTQKSTGLVDSSSQTQAGIASIQAIRQQITGYEVQLAGLLQRETENAPEVVTMRSQIRQLEAKESQMESSTGAVPVGAAPSAAGMPDKNLDLLRATRDVREHETIVESMSRQYETARLAEAEKSSTFQVIDMALVPDRKAWPPRKTLLYLAIAISFLLGLMGAIAKRFWLRMAADPASQEQFARLRAGRTA
ncbi:GNVR domain-containing protein [Granulicella cerasi]|uniref:GNVR domain-containing protein n=1 Tax=Granulicella cerasi TaxID=741063 RepID=A0ABW1ZAB0_9BACT|nr:GNVR domain-containing protein [Granulicella cerasi]